jgi:outer membrane protein OmpA-like peptidoglycan-associated protein
MTRTHSTRLRALGWALLLGLAMQPALADQAAEVDALIRQLAPTADHLESAGPAPESTEIHGRRIYIVPNRSVDLSVYFAFDSAELTHRARADLTALGYALASQALRPHSYLIAGHTDAKGDAGHNQWLSERRAESVVRFLIQNFPIDPDRLIAVGWGESRLKTPGTPDAAINRRVEVTLIRHIGYGPGAAYGPEAATAVAPDPATPAAPQGQTPSIDAPLPGTLQQNKDGGITITW